MSNRILVIRLGSLGDVILTSATVLNLKIAYPDSHLTFLTKARFASVAALLPGVDEVITLEEAASNRDYFHLLLDLDHRNFDKVIDLHGNLRSWFARKVIQAGSTFAYPKRRLSRWLTVRHMTTPDDVPHTIDLYNRALEDSGVVPYADRPVIARPHVAATATDATGDRLSVVLAPGAAHQTKQWPIERFGKLAQMLVERHGCQLHWVAMSQDRLSTGLTAALGEALNECIDWPLDRLVSLFSSAHLVISNDSGLMHLASAVGAPVLAIFGPTHSNLGFAPRGVHDQMIEVEEPCRPCSLHGNKACFRSEQFCFTRITPELVAARADEILSQPLSSAIFFDRDGTLMSDRHYLSDPDQVELISGTIDALRTGRSLGYKLVSLSNQSGVARGIFTVREMKAVQERFEEKLAEAGIRLDASATCPHYPFGSVAPYSVACRCRKPHPGMAEHAARALRVNLNRSIVIGDKLDDLNLGLVIGARSVLVRTGHGRSTEESLRFGGLYGELGRFDTVKDAVASLGR